MYARIHHAAYDDSRTPLGIEPVDGSDQAQVSFLDQVHQILSREAILVGDLRDQPKVRTHQLTSQAWILGGMERLRDGQLFPWIEHGIPTELPYVRVEGRRRASVWRGRSRPANRRRTVVIVGRRQNRD